MEDLPINLVDLAVIVVILLSAVFAFVRGSAHELLSVGSWIGAALVALYSFPHLQPIARRHIDVPLVADLGTAAAVFLIALVVFAILTRVVAKRVQTSSLGALDRSLGAIFGLARGAVIVCVAWVLFAWLTPREDMPDFVTEARTLPLVETGSIYLVSLLPEEFRPEPAGTPDRGGVSFERLNAPGASGGASGTEPTYNDDLRKGMQRAIEDALESAYGSGKQSDGEKSE